MINYSKTGRHICVDENTLGHKLLWVRGKNPHPGRSNQLPFFLSIFKFPLKDWILFKLMLSEKFEDEKSHTFLMTAPLSSNLKKYIYVRFFSKFLVFLGNKNFMISKKNPHNLIFYRYFWNKTVIVIVMVIIPVTETSFSMRGLFLQD